MSLPRFFLTAPLPRKDTCELPLSSADVHHIHVLRIGSGEHIAVSAPDRSSWEVELDDVRDDGVQGHVIAELAAEQVPDLTLVQGVSKGERMDQTIRQTCELGVRRIIPYLSERSIVRLKGADVHKKGDRWRRIAESAAKQCGRSTMALVDDPVTQVQLLEELASFDCIVVPWEEKAGCEAASIGQALAKTSLDDHVALVIGPEGGFSPAEIEAFQGLSCEVHIVSMGELILRTETAAVVASALSIYTLGGLGNRR